MTVSDKRHKRRNDSRNDLIAALKRLQDGCSTHPKHIGIKVRITKESVAREARKSPATLYRLPDVVALIDSVRNETPQKQTIPAAEARRKALVDEISELKKKNALLVAEQFRLRRLLAAYDPLLGESPPSDLKAASEKKRLIHSKRQRIDD